MLCRGVSLLTLLINSPRLAGVLFSPQSFDKAASAACTASSTSALDPTATSQIFSPVAGYTTGIRLCSPPLGVFHSPPMKRPSGRLSLVPLGALISILVMLDVNGGKERKERVEETSSTKGVGEWGAR